MGLVIDVYGTVLYATYGQVYWWVNKVLRKIHLHMRLLEAFENVLLSLNTDMVLIVYKLQLLTDLWRRFI